MSELPQLDPVKLYNKAMKQVNDLTNQALQMDTMIEVLVEERDTAIEERDKAQQQLHELTAKLEVAKTAKTAGKKTEQEPVIEGTVV